MARIRREKKWTVSETSVAGVRDAIGVFLAHRRVRVTAEADGAIDGQGGSALTSPFAWTDKTAPFRVHVSLWTAGDSVVVVEAAFEERPQVGTAGPVKSKKYSKLADEFLDDLRAKLGLIGPLDADSASRVPPAADIPDQIKKLSDLRDAGVLTAEEFEAKKSQLLDRM
jgi:hypothetical protein